MKTEDRMRPRRITLAENLLSKEKPWCDEERY
jgi:hypothetical protein